MPVSKRRNRSVVGLLALVATAIFLLPASEASAAIQSNACVNNILAGESSSIPITMTANAAPSSIKAGETVTLSEIKQELEVPPTVFLSGYSLELLTIGKNEIPTKVQTTIAATNATNAETNKNKAVPEEVVPGITNIAETVAVTTITDPTPGNRSSGDETATPGVVKATYNDQTWTATGGSINFREATVIEPLAANPPGFTATIAGVTIEALVGGGAIKAKFGCDPGTVVEKAPPSTIVRTDPAATFASVAGTDYALNLSTTGTGSGSFQCDTGKGAEACKATYGEGTKVKVIANPSAGSKFIAFGGDCSSTSCEVTMTAAHSVSAQFDLESRSLSVTESGSGTVACEVNGSPQPCSGEYPYGSTVKVVATPAAENNVGSLTGTGSAAGKCSVVTGICEFKLTENSSVAVVFEPAGTKAIVEGNVHGTVPQTTTIESFCSDVNLGKFLPGVKKDNVLVEGGSYENSCAVKVTSTGEATSLTAADLTGIDTGHLTQKPLHNYSLPLPLFTGAKELSEPSLGGVAGTGGALTSPVSLMTWAVPFSKDLVGVGFRQPIGEHDPLHTGEYAKMITLTLQQTTP